MLIKCTLAHVILLYMSHLCRCNSESKKSIASLYHYSRISHIIYKARSYDVLCDLINPSRLNRDVFQKVSCENQRVFISWLWPMAFGWVNSEGSQGSNFLLLCNKTIGSLIEYTDVRQLWLVLRWLLWCLLLFLVLCVSHVLFKMCLSSDLCIFLYF